MLSAYSFIGKASTNFIIIVICFFSNSNITLNYSVFILRRRGSCYPAYCQRSAGSRHIVRQIDIAAEANRTFPPPPPPTHTERVLFDTAVIRRKTSQWRRHGSGIDSRLTGKRGAINPQINGTPAPMLKGCTGRGSVADLRRGKMGNCPP